MMNSVAVRGSGQLVGRKQRRDEERAHGDRVHKNRERNRAGLHRPPDVGGLAGVALLRDWTPSGGGCSSPGKHDVVRGDAGEATTPSVTPVTIEIANKRAHDEIRARRDENCRDDGIARHAIRSREIIWRRRRAMQAGHREGHGRATRPARKCLPVVRRFPSARIRCRAAR